nr:retrotransposon protein, putative, Ty1-copia subclass [Tanacetum cinerariifolium]
HTAWVKGSKEVAGVLLMTMEPEIQQNLEPLHDHEMLKELKTLFAQQAEQDLLQTTRDFHSCRQEEGQSNGKDVNELHAMLKLHDQTLPKSNTPTLNAIQADNEVWDLVELPPNGKTVGSKWLFKKKTDMDGNVHIYKARLVVKGLTQTLGIDYEETFSRVADIRAIRILIAIAANYDYEIWQMDVKTAFLNGYLNEDVYMEKPEDDILLMGNSIPMLQSVKTYLGNVFHERSSAYIEKILKRYCMENSKHGSIHMQEKLKLSKSQGASTLAEMKRMQNVPYASAVGSIMYAVRCTRPDVPFAQNITS